MDGSGSRPGLCGSHWCSISITRAQRPSRRQRLWTSVLICSFEKICLDGLSPIPKDPTQLQTYERIDEFTQRHVRQCVLYLILNERRPILLPEAMGVHPVLVRTTSLDIHKCLRRVSALNFRLPGKRDTKEMQSVLDACLFAEVDGLRRHNLKPQFWRGNPFQVGCLSKEGKDLVTREWKTHRGGQGVHHSSIAFQGVRFRRRWVI